MMTSEQIDKAFDYRLNWIKTEIKFKKSPDIIRHLNVMHALTNVSYSCLVRLLEQSNTSSGEAIETFTLHGEMIKNCESHIQKLEENQTKLIGEEFQDLREINQRSIDSAKSQLENLRKIQHLLLLGSSTVSSMNVEYLSGSLIEIWKNHDSDLLNKILLETIKWLIGLTPQGWLYSALIAIKEITESERIKGDNADDYLSNLGDYQFVITQWCLIATMITHFSSNDSNKYSIKEASKEVNEEIRKFFESTPLLD